MPGDVLVGKYRVDRIIGHGGMGFVVEAWHLGFEEHVAIKLLRADVAENVEAQVRFEREARAAFKIKNEHIARVIDVGRLDSGAPFMVMEYLEGTDLGEVLAERRTLPVEEAVDYVLQACEAIAEAHAHGIIHRDLKPENLFLAERADGSRSIKVLDFGLSKVLPKVTEAPRERALTDTKQVMGTAEYMSPEQWMSARDVGPATDIWSIGIILYELICGQTPFEREQLAQMCQAILGSEPPPMRSLRADAPLELERTILMCLAKNPTDRFASIGELAGALVPFAPDHARASAQRMASQPPLGSRSKPPPPIPSVPGLPRGSGPGLAAPSGRGGEPGIPSPPGVPSVPEAVASVPQAGPSAPPPAPSSASVSAVPAESARSSMPGAAPWSRPSRTWAEVMQDRAPRSSGGWRFLVVLLITASAATAGLVWANRNAFDPEQPASSGRSSVAPASSASAGARPSGDPASASSSSAGSLGPGARTTAGRRAPSPRAKPVQ